MHLLKIILSILVIALGAFLFVYGEYDDSPGGMLLGVVIGSIGMVSGIKVLKNLRHSQTK